MPDQGTSDARELDFRRSDGLEVRLVWVASEDRVTVTVEDRRTGRQFAVDVRDGESPLDVFHHPYAYAVWHGTSRGDEAPELTFRAA